MDNVGDRIRVVRIARNLSQVKLAAAAGMNSTRLCRIEKGRGPYFDEVVRIARALDQSIVDFVPGEGGARPLTVTFMRG